jgi:hypothetical protein
MNIADSIMKRIKAQAFLAPAAHPLATQSVSM